MAEEIKTNPDGTPIKEYPKMLYHEKGSTIVHSKDEEDELTGKVKVENKSEEDKTKIKVPAWAKDK